MKHSKRRSDLLYDFAIMAVVFALIIVLVVLVGCVTVTKKIDIYVTNPNVEVKMEQ